jgi:hypothetical protein
MVLTDKTFERCARIVHRILETHNIIGHIGYYYVSPELREPTDSYPLWSINKFTPRGTIKAMLEEAYDLSDRQNGPMALFMPYCNLDELIGCLHDNALMRSFVLWGSRDLQEDATLKEIGRIKMSAPMPLECFHAILRHNRLKNTGISYKAILKDVESSLRIEGFLKKGLATTESIEMCVKQGLLFLVESGIAFRVHAGHFWTACEHSKQRDLFAIPPVHRPGEIIHPITGEIIKSDQKARGNLRHFKINTNYLKGKS